MKKLLNFLLVFVLALCSCKQYSKNDSKTENTTEHTVNDKQEMPESSHIDTAQTIEAFLKKLQVAVINNDSITIEKCIKFPIEFNSGGESLFFNNYKEIQDNTGKFAYILQISSIEKEEDVYILTYQQKNVRDYFVDFFAVREGNGFKITGFSQPH